MSHDELEKFTADIVKRTIEEMQSNGGISCVQNCPYNLEQHRQHHEFCERAIEVLGKVDDIKWGVFKAVAIAAVFAMLAFVGLKIK